jgi:hypothetical protein
MSKAIDEIRRTLESGGAASGFDRSYVLLLYSNYVQLMENALELHVVEESDRVKQNVVDVAMNHVRFARKMDTDNPRRIDTYEEGKNKDHLTQALKAIEAGNPEMAAANLRLMRLP